MMRSGSLTQLRSLCFNDCNNYFSFLRNHVTVVGNCWELKVLCGVALLFNRIF
jgi:hypothetical protein